MSQLIVVTGPARSGKSEWAEALAAQSHKSVIYIATAQIDPSDPEWQSRIAQHQARRPATWTTLAVPVALADAIRQGGTADCLLVDSLGTWLANGLEQSDALWSETVIDLLTALRQAHSDLILVAEETGWGVVPAYPIGRLFRDRLGALVRQIGQFADVVYLVTGGYVLNLTHLGVPLSQRLPPEDGSGNCPANP